MAVVYPAAEQASMPSRKLVLLVVCGSVSRRDPVKSMYDMGVDFVCLNDSIVGWAKSSQLIKDWILCDVSNHEEAQAATDSFLSERNISFDAVFCYDEFGLHLASVLAMRYGLPFTPTSTIVQVRDKYAFRQKCIANGIPAPKCLRLDLNWKEFSSFREHNTQLTKRQPCCDLKDEACSKCQVLYWAFFEGSSGVVPQNPLSETLQKLNHMFTEANVSFPVVIKPTHGAGKMFVKKVVDFVDLMDVIYNFVIFNIDYKHRFFLSFEEAAGIFVEEFIDGIEVDVDCLVQKVDIYILICQNPHLSSGRNSLLQHQRKSACTGAVLSRAWRHGPARKSLRITTRLAQSTHTNCFEHV